VWLYHRFCLSFRDVEDLLAERGITVSNETIRRWCTKFGPHYVRQLQKRQGGPGGDIWFVDRPLGDCNTALIGERPYNGGLIAVR
jgi:putative transposase